ncbi:YkvA family protein [Geothrix sp. 21YS21S-4]|uniref:YkvA family protein n=1 Tax=Geothrix sp. 21YS21S-4 TaxID=3068889 RepID=UPI0027B8BB8A|nr:YkvA family protein [Geothrix sp. 21YS21S-4]
MTEQNQGFSNEYSDERFWEKLKRYAKTAGKEVIEKALWLYYAAQEKETPLWAKAVCYGALGYFISPIDAIPDVTPVVGYADDLSVF